MNVVFDLDGTLADCTHRLHFIYDKPQDWDSFYRACAVDKPIWPAWNVMQALIMMEQSVDEGFAHRHPIEIWTGRSEGEGGEFRELTSEWLYRHFRLMPFNLAPYEFFNPNYVGLRMRPHKNFKPDVDLKRKWLHECREQGKEVDLVFEDREKVVAMWRMEQVKCFQVATGAY